MLYNQFFQIMVDAPTPRIIKETNNLKTENIPGILCEVDAANFRHFYVKIEGIVGCMQDLKRLAIRVGSSMPSCFSLTTIL